MDRFFAMLIFFCILVSLLLVLLALFAQAPIICSCLVSLFYALYIFLANESHEVHHAQEYENRFWTIFAALCSTAAFFAVDSPLAFGSRYPSFGFVGVIICGYGMHTWDRHAHRQDLSRRFASSLRLGGSSINNLTELGVPMKDLIVRINSLLRDIDQNFIPSTVNNFINSRFILKTEREIINIFEEAQPKALNYLIGHSKLGLLFYKVKDHRRFNHRHRTQLIELLAIDRVSQLTVQSKVIVLHSLQMMKLPANTKAEHWVRNIILSAKQDELSDLKTLADARGNWYCMSKLIYDDIRSDMVRQDILNHIQREAKVQYAHLKMKTKRSKQLKDKGHAWRKILSDVDDTLTCSGGSYPAGVDKRYGKKVVYPGVLAFYRELDLGYRDGTEEWGRESIGNLVFLSARPHLYKDVTEKRNFDKFKKLQRRTHTSGGIVKRKNGSISDVGGCGGNNLTANKSRHTRGGMHTAPSLLAGDLTSGTEFLIKNDYEPLALKKFENFKKYVSIYPEYQHVFVCDNGQGDVRAGEMMIDNFPGQVEAIYVHIVQDVNKTYKYNSEKWGSGTKRGVNPFFFQTYPEAALDAVTRKPQPLISVSGLGRICQDAVNDFYMIKTKDWPSQKHKWDRRDELNQALWRCNMYLGKCGREAVPLVEMERLWKDGDRVSTPYGIGTVLTFDAVFDLYEVEVDWRPLCAQVEDELKRSKLSLEKKEKVKNAVVSGSGIDGRPLVQLETVFETVEEIDEDAVESSHHPISVSPDPCSDGNNNATNISDGASIALDREETDQRSEKVVEGIISLGNKTEIKEEVTGEATLGILTSTSEEEKETQSCGDDDVDRNVFYPVIAKIQGRLISKYIPPKLPVFPKDDDDNRTSGFSFWSSKPNAPTFKKGDDCSTPFGPGSVVEYREEEGIVIILFSKWSARAYLNRDVVKIGDDCSGEEKSFFGSLLRKITTAETLEKVVLQQQHPKEVEFPFEINSIVQTPFGEGKVFCLPPLGKQERTTIATSLSPSNEKVMSAHQILKEGTDGRNSPDSSATLNETNEIIGIFITSWILANGSYPRLYCTVENAFQWKFVEGENRSKTSGILSVFGSFLSQSMKRIAMKDSNKEITQEVPSEILVPGFERYYKDGAAVTTPFGLGEVQSFRESDGFYDVSLIKWNMKGDVSPTIYLMKDTLNYHVSNGCHEGYPVLTSLGLSGNLASVQPTTGVHIVTVPMAGMVCYLQPKDVLRPLKAAVTEDVLTLYGEGKVEKYRLEDDMYEIELHHGSKLFAKAEAFDRVSDGFEDQADFGMKWLLRFLFFGSGNGESQRSRSNSIASVSVISQSSRSKI